MVKNQGTKQGEQRTLGDCWQWEANGQCVKGDNCSFRHDMNKRGKSTQPDPSPRSSTRQNEKNASRTRSPRGRSPSGRMSRLPCKDHLKGTKGLAPLHSAKSGILQNARSTSPRMVRKPIRCVRFTKVVVRHASVRDQNPSLGMICPGDPHQRNPNAPKFEDRSQEETEWQERCAREAAWKLAKKHPQN